MARSSAHLSLSTKAASPRLESATSSPGQLGVACDEVHNSQRSAATISNAGRGLRPHKQRRVVVVAATHDIAGCASAEEAEDEQLWRRGEEGGGGSCSCSDLPPQSHRRPTRDDDVDECSRGRAGPRGFRHDPKMPTAIGSVGSEVAAKVACAPPPPPIQSTRRTLTATRRCSGELSYQLSLTCSAPRPPLERSLPLIARPTRLERRGCLSHHRRAVGP